MALLGGSVVKRMEGTSEVLVCGSIRTGEEGKRTKTLQLRGDQIEREGE